MSRGTLRMSFRITGFLRQAWTSCRSLSALLSSSPRCGRYWTGHSHRLSPLMPKGLRCAPAYGLAPGGSRRLLRPAAALRAPAARYASLPTASLPAALAVCFAAGAALRAPAARYASLATGSLSAILGLGRPRLPWLRRLGFLEADRHVILPGFTRVELRCPKRHEAVRLEFLPALA